jgi:hypothetical protein
MLTGSLLCSSSIVQAETQQIASSEEIRVLYNIVTVKRLKAEILSESMRWHVFVNRFGDPGFVDSDVRDYYEDIVPTPGQPPVHHSWQPGDQVTYIRRATDGQYNYERTTTYERQGNGDWGRQENRVKRTLCEGPCPSVQ